MTDVKISELPVASALTGSELLEAVQGGTSKQTTTAEVAALASRAVVTAVTGTAYTVLAADVGKFLRFTNTSAKAATVEPEATAALPANGEWYFFNQGTNNLTLVAGSGVAITPPAGGTLVVPSGGTVALKRLAADSFVVLGNTVP